MWLLISKDRLVASMVTEISPVFGMSLIALIEMATIIGAAVGIGSAVIIARVISNSNRALLRQHRKVDSARMIRELHGPWRNNDRFKEFLQDLNSPQVITYDSEIVGQFLNRFELIATLLEDGTINEFHVRSFFSANLKTMRSDRFILDRIAEAQKINPRTFMYLVRLFEKSEKWNN